MQLEINRSPGLRNDLLVSVSHNEIDDTLFHIANRDRLMQLPGLLRHVIEQDQDERRQVSECKIPVEDHLKLLLSGEHKLVNPDGSPTRRFIVVGSRNIGNNHGFVAWQKGEKPPLFHVKDDPLSHKTYSCVVRRNDGKLEIRSLRFTKDSVFDGEVDITEDVSWGVFANQILKDGQVVNIEEIIDRFYDIRHVLAFDRQRAQGRQVEAGIYERYPEQFRTNALKALQELGTPRNRFLHNCLGLSETGIYIIQREGTIEEVATWLKDAGARDGVILDNGGSVFCWASWLYPNGGYLYAAPDFRPPSSAVIAFVLKGPAATNLPGGSVSYSVV